MVGISRILKAGGKLLFDPTFQDTVTETIKASRKAIGYRNIPKQIGDAFVKAERTTRNTPFWSNLKDSLKNLFPDMKNAWKTASGFGGKSKGVFKELWKRMPLIGVLMTAAFEVPNILSAFKDKGLFGGVAETGKSTIRLAGATSGFMIGQGLIPIPIVGGIIGACVGDWLTSKIVGKSHTEKKAIAESQGQVPFTEFGKDKQLDVGPLSTYPYPAFSPNRYLAMSSQNYMQPTINPQQLMAMQQMLYSGGLGDPMNQDFMAMNSGINRLNYMC